MRRMTWAVLVAIALTAGALFLALGTSSTLFAQGDPTATPTVTVTPSPTLCPMGTPEPLWVDPVISPTSLLTQTIRVAIGNGEAVTVTTQTGVFTTTGTFGAMHPALVTINLAPNATNDLTVTARVRQISLPGGCPAGGYTLQTTRDRDGGPLRIVQQSATATPTPTASLTATPTPTPTATGTPEFKQYFPYVARIAPGAPGAPQLDISLVLGGSMTLTWSTVSAASGYVLVEATAPDLSNAIVLYAGQNTSFSLLPPVGPHYFAVYAVNAVGHTASNVVSFNYVPPPPQIGGRVTDNGAPAAGILLRLRHFDGSAWSDAATTTTAADGTYLFATVPALAVGQIYYVLYPNAERINTRLGGYGTSYLTTLAAGAVVTFPAFDIKNIPLRSPSPGVTARLPATFAWTRRDVAGDNYAWRLINSAGDLSEIFASERLGDAEGYTLIDLPNGVSLGSPYGWSVLVYGPSGNPSEFGVSYFYRTVTFAARNKLGDSTDLEEHPIPNVERFFERAPRRQQR